MNDKELYNIAKSALVKAYAPYSNFSVGAALLGANGQVYTGVNVENSSFGATICAERTAFTKAISEGCKEFSAIAVTSSEGEAFPCGICRQFMFEYGDDLRIIVGNNENELRSFTISELLPHGFRLNQYNISK